MKEKTIRAVVMGASAGAIDALSSILPHLSREYRLPILIVVHLPSERDSALIDVFAQKCQLSVKEAEEKTFPEGGTIYFSPPDYHLLVEPDFSLSLSSEEPVLYCRPSIDVLFETAAEAYGESLCGIILTGANEDGALGLNAVAARGGTAVVQNPQTAFSPAMPLAALASCPEAVSMNLEEITTFLKDIGEE